MPKVERDGEEALKPGERIGDYEILAELGAGGMGRVYRARDLTLERIVALKTLSPALRNDEMLVQRFLKEARAAARLNHPNIVQIYDFGKEGDTYYLAMEYVEGDSLATLLKGGPFSEPEAITIARLACRALVTAHAEGLVHRDIKPDNLMLTSKGDLKLVDLGVAKRLGEDQSLTQTGQAVGTPHYISPEQIRAATDIDGRADIYSLGATLYHLVTGKTPFRGTSSALVMSMHLYQPFDDPRTFNPSLSEGLGQVLRKMMAKEPSDRYADADAADRDLYQLEIGEVPEAASYIATDTPIDSTGETHAQATSVDRVMPPPAIVHPTPSHSRTPVAARPPTSSALPVPKASQVSSASQIPSAGPSPELTPPKNSGLQSMPAATVTSEPNLRVLETELAKHVGPLARVLVKRAAKSATSLRQLIAALEHEIADEKMRRTFRSAVEKLR